MLVSLPVAEKLKQTDRIAFYTLDVGAIHGVPMSNIGIENVGTTSQAGFTHRELE